MFHLVLGREVGVSAKRLSDTAEEWIEKWTVAYSRSGSTPLSKLAVSYTLPADTLPTVFGTPFRPAAGHSRWLRRPDQARALLKRVFKLLDCSGSA